MSHEVLSGYFPSGYQGTYLDIGAGDPELISNSNWFRINGWKIYAIEPHPKLALRHELVGNRVVRCAVGSTSKTIKFNMYDNEQGWGGNVSTAKNCAVGPGCKVKKIKCRTLDDILENEFQDMGEIDIMDLDVELYEMEVLKGFDLKKYMPKVIFIEDHYPDISGIFERLTSHCYKLDKRVGYDNYYVNIQS